MACRCLLVYCKISKPRSCLLQTPVFFSAVWRHHPIIICKIWYRVVFDFVFLFPFAHRTYPFQQPDKWIRPRPRPLGPFIEDFSGECIGATSLDAVTSGTNSSLNVTHFSCNTLLAKKTSKQQQQKNPQQLLSAKWKKNAYKQLNFVIIGNQRGDQMVSHLALCLDQILSLTNTSLKISLFLYGYLYLPFLSSPCLRILVLSFNFI